MKRKAALVTGASRDVGAAQRPLSSAAASPAMRPNTEPAVRPVPPG